MSVQELYSSCGIDQMHKKNTGEIDLMRDSAPNHSRFTREQQLENLQRTGDSHKKFFWVPDSVYDIYGLGGDLRVERVLASAKYAASKVSNLS